MNKVTSKKRHHPSKDKQLMKTDGIQNKSQAMMTCLSTGGSGFVISCKQNVSKQINENKSKNVTIPG